MEEQATARDRVRVDHSSTTIRSDRVVPPNLVHVCECSDATYQSFWIV